MSNLFNVVLAAISSVRFAVASRKAQLASLTITVALLANQAGAAPITLQNPTATTFQGGFPIINTLTDDITGWATNGAAAVGVYEIASPLVEPIQDFTFTLKNNNNNGDHVLGKFRLSVSTDTQPLTAGSGTWTQLAPISASALFSNPVNFLANDVIEVTDVDATNDTIIVTAQSTGILGITGIRLEAIQDGGTGSMTGPGTAANNNFVLSFFSVDAVGSFPVVPEPSTFALLGLGVVSLMGRRCRKGRVAEVI